MEVQKKGEERCNAEQLSQSEQLSLMEEHQETGDLKGPRIKKTRGHYTDRSKMIEGKSQ